MRREVDISGVFPLAPRSGERVPSEARQERGKS